jgi:ferrochelatase
VAVSALIAPVSMDIFQAITIGLYNGRGTGHPVLEMTESYDALLVVSFGGPEGMSDVMPFLQNVLKGKSVPMQRIKEVAKHYELFGGISPINQQNRQLIQCLKEDFERRHLSLPIYWGNRNWHPMLSDTIRLMAENSIKSCLTFVTSAYNSYSGCRQYLEDIDKARLEVQKAPRIDKLRAFYNHPGFILPMVENVLGALDKLNSPDRDQVPLAFTAHSIPMEMAYTCEYERQLTEACKLVSERVGPNPWQLVYQSRSGPPEQQWLEPDICKHLWDLKGSGASSVVVVPIGFISDHMEVIYDLDIEARQIANQLGLKLERAATVGCHPRFIRMIYELIMERLSGTEKLVLGDLGPSPDVCAVDCCNYQAKAFGASWHKR